MRRLLLFGLLGFWSSAASAATLSWERGVGADSCAQAANIQREVEQRLTQPLVSLRPKQRVHVSIERSAGAWVARVVMRDDEGKLEGERTLSVTADNCRKIEQYTVIVVALALEGDAMADDEPAAAVTTLEPEQPAAAPAPPEPLAPPPQPASAQRSPPAPTQLPRVSGAGELCLFLQGPVYGPGSASAPAASAAIRTDGLRLQSALAVGLTRRALFTVIEVAPSFEDELSLRSWLRKAKSGPAPMVALAAGSGLEPLAYADYVIVPLIETLTIQDGIDYSLGADPRALVVNAHVTLLGFDFVSRRELQPVAVSASLAFASAARDTATVRLALQTALESIATDASKSLGEQHPAFASQLRAASGARRVCAPARSSGKDARVAQAARDSTWEAGFYLDAVKRVAYAQPSEADLARARATGLRTQELGPATEFGVGARLAPRARNDAGWRPGFDLRAASVDTQSAPLILELQGGVGYELPFWPVVGLALLPRLNGGLLFSSGTLGRKDRERGQLQTFLGATAHFDLTVPFYRVVGDFSPFVTLGAEYVLPLLSDAQRSGFVDSELPELHAVGVEIGFFMRGPLARSQ